MGIVASGASALCCAAEGACCCASCLTCLCSRGGGSKGPSAKLAKIMYLFIIILSTILALVLRAYGSDLFVSFYSFKFGCTGGIADRCFGDQAVYRVSFACAVFFFFMLLGSASKQFHRGFWGLKFILWGVLVTGAFFIPNQLYNVYAEISRVVSILFLILMILILIDFAYTVQEKVFDRIERRDEAMSEEYETVGLCQNPWKLLYLVICLVLLGIGFAGLVAMYSFSAHNSCSANIGFLSITLIVGLVLCIMSTLEAFGARGLLCPSLVWLYAVWLVWSGITSNPDATCNPFGSQTNNGWAIFLGLLVSGLSLAYTSWSAASSAPQLCGGGDDDDLSSSLIDDRARSDDAAKVVTGEIATDADLEKARAARGSDDEDDAASDDEGRALTGAGSGSGEARGKDKPWFFHLIMLTASLYMAMLLSNWGAGSTDHDTTSVGETSMWIKIVSEWVTFILYFWTLVAPRCFPDRQFA